MFEKYNIRIDPLKDNGTFDTDFYESSDYKCEASIVKKYIIDEGFAEDKRQFSIKLLEREWWVNIN